MKAGLSIERIAERLIRVLPSRLRWRRLKAAPLIERIAYRIVVGARA